MSEFLSDLVKTLGDEHTTIASDEKSGGLRFKLLELNDKPFEQLRKSKKFTKRNQKLRKKKS